MNINLIKECNCAIIDLDGTLLNSKSMISENSLLAIRNFQKSGRRIVLASGRPYSLIRKYIAIIGLTSTDYVIARDGTYIYTGEGSVVFESEMLSLNDLNSLYERFHKSRTCVYTPSCDYILISKYIDYILLKRRYRTTGTVVLNKYSSLVQILRNKKIEKIRFTYKDPIIDFSDEDYRYAFYKVDNNTIEVRPKNVNKYSGILNLFSIIHEDIQMCVFFGDDYNDKACFENLKCTVAMGNADDEIKRIARFQTETNDNDGVAYFLNMITSDR